MKSIGNFLPPNWKEDIQEAMRRAEANKLARIRQYDWSDDCECDLCGDTGIYPEKQTFCSCDEGRSQERDAMLAEEWKVICPDRYWNMTLDTHPNKEAARRVQQWVDNGFKKRTNLVISGSVGTGKTALALGAMRQIHMRGIGCKFGTFSMILDQLRPRDPQDVSTQRENVDTLSRKGLLVIDDLGTHKETEWTAQMLFDLINERTSNKRPFIITTNLTEEQMKSMLDDRLVSRIAESSEMLTVIGKDMRRTRPAH